MTQELLLQKIKEIQAEWSAKLGTLTDIWIHPDLLDTLDGRHLVERVQDPLQIAGTYVTPFSPLHKNQIRIAFITEVDFDSLEEEQVDELASPDRFTPSSE